MRCILVIVSFAFSSILLAQQVRIGVFRDHAMKRLTFSYNDGSYALLGDTNYFGSILPNEFADLSFNNGKVILRKGTIELGTFTKVYLIQNQPGTSLTLTPKQPSVKPRKYEDDFEVTATEKGLTVINLVDMDNYLAGVVESEGGGGKHLEYYKVQAVMSRTYAFKYSSKHKSEGFDLCDRVHCQAYHNMLRFTPLIDSAVRLTRHIVLCHKEDELTDSYFHANCGGQTCEPQYIWNGKVEYLKTFKDTFCIYTKQAKWEKRVPKQKWRDYLVRRYNYPVNDSVLSSLIYTFDQSERKAFYIHPALGIPLRDLREEFDLKSTFFSCYPDGDDVVIKGRGFGHGVGLCQEGAMKMARSGFGFDQILRFYFPGSRLLNRNELIYFGQSNESNDLE
ncbi:MAG: SpoIID/LytB domain-containing protein [Bacteroidota bacterium]